MTGSNTSANDSNTCSSKSNIVERSLDGRPIGYKGEKQERREAKKVMKVENEIDQRMMEARDTVKRNNKHIKNGFMSELIG